MIKNAMSLKIKNAMSLKTKINNIKIELDLLF